MNERLRPIAKKRAVNLSIDEKLLSEAREDGVNLSAVLERALTDDRARRWRKENEKAIKAHNRRVAKRGLWSDGWRSW